MSDFWTGERIEQLKALWYDHSASEILRIMGAPSRNAVLAKASRLVAKGQLKPKAVAGVSLSQSRRTANPGPRAKPPPTSRPLPAPREEPKADLIDGAAITVINILHHQCRWPIGDPLEASFHFCGQKKQHDSSYCPFHSARAWAPAARRAAS